MKKLIYLSAAFLMACSAPKEEPVDLVNTFIGTGGHGHTYPGASLPFGMMQLSPDTRLEGWDGCGGYHYSDSIIFGFSHTHLSGTGIADYADILFMPTSGEVKMHNGIADGSDRGYSSLFSHMEEKASPGYYFVHLKDHSVDVELTVDERSGIHRYTFNEDVEQNVIIDLAHRDMVLESSLRKVSDTEIEGMRRSRSWAQDQVVYFVAKTDRPIVEFGISDNGELIEDGSAEGTDIKAYLRFDPEESDQLQIKVGISATSIEAARKNLKEGIGDKNFDEVAENAREVWNTELSKIEVKGGTQDQRRIFYSALYHSFLAPNLFSNVDGSYRGTDLKVHISKEKVYTVFSLWDTFRATHPLYTLVQRERTAEFLSTFEKQYTNGGQLPVWELAGNYTGCMIGYHSIPVIVDAYVKGITDFDTDLMLGAMVAIANQDHLGLDAYKTLGFIPSGAESESASKTLEYAYDDWCIATFAIALGQDSIAARFYERAQSYKNLFDPSTGFFRARLNGGWFGPFDPAEVNFNYTEANAWQYSQFAPQDVNGHIDLMGGDKVYWAQLDDLFSAESETTGREQVDITGLIGQYAHGNEPSHHMAYLYTYAGKPWRTQELVRQIMNQLYSNAPDGLRGNEDCGQMSSWFVLSAMGFYSVTPGSDIYVIGSPLFDEATIHLENGMDFTIKARNNSSGNVYIRSAKLNGSDFTRSFINHSEIMQGGVLEFEMGAEPNYQWASSPETRPVSLIDAPDMVPVPFLISAGRTFKDSLRIIPGSSAKDVRYMTRLSSEEDFSEKGQFYLFGSDTVWTYAVNADGKKSRTVSGVFYRIDDDIKIDLHSKYANQYSAGGDNALIDKIKGGQDFRTGSWQGYREDLEFVIDLGEEKPISKISIGFLQDVKSWIWMPKEVSFAISLDGENFLELGSKQSGISEDLYGGMANEISLNFPKTKTRYIKVVAEQYGVCPDWHIGAGGKSWIFADEVTIQ